MNVTFSKKLHYISVFFLLPQSYPEDQLGLERDSGRSPSNFMTIDATTFLQKATKINPTRICLLGLQSLRLSFW